MKDSEYPLDLVALQTTMEAIGSKWRVRVLCSICMGNNRYSEIEKSIDGLTPRMLSKELKDCESLGLIVRVIKSEKPLSVEYRITEKTMTMESIFREMVAWGIKQNQSNNKL